ncbi:protein PET100 homolog, mitochondrial-like [Oscarella lobularis]|uniref:protein PET100 homolog, mitochondrial-like n=1 Tax=Oscarella lobularis TaxID=121494 RepID=UPI003313FCC9
MKAKKSALEIMRMGVYVFFPVAVFYVFNHPDFFDKFVEEKRRVFFPQSNRPPLDIEENRRVLQEKIKERKLKATEKSN